MDQLDFFLGKQDTSNRERFPGLRGRPFVGAQNSFATHISDHPRYQISDTNAERDYIIAELSNNRVIKAVTAVTSYQPRQHLTGEHVNHYIIDGEVDVGEPGLNRRRRNGYLWPHTN